MGFTCIVCGRVYNEDWKAELCHVHLKYVFKGTEIRKYQYPESSDNRSLTLRNSEISSESRQYTTK